MPARKTVTPIANDQSTWSLVDLLEFVRPLYLSLRPFMVRGDFSDPEAIIMALAVQAPFMVSARLFLNSLAFISDFTHCL